MGLDLDIKPFLFRLKKILSTSKGLLSHRKGWLLRVENEFGDIGWGEVSPMSSTEWEICSNLIQSLRPSPTREELELLIPTWPGSLGFGFGAAFAELDGLVGSKSKTAWLTPPTSAFLLTVDKDLISTIDFVETAFFEKKNPITIKLKVGMGEDLDEQNLIRNFLDRLPGDYRLRLDPNTAWDRIRANYWADCFLKDPRLEWFEQPLPANDVNGLRELAKRVPIALDESLFFDPSLRNTWKGWQVRRPTLEGDPRELLRQLDEGIAYVALSTAFETGIGFRWVSHLAALQQKGPTPTAPGLAPGWSPEGDLFSADPQLVWEAV